MDELDATPELPDPEPDGSVNTEESLERPVAWDEYTGLRLDPDLVYKSRREEIQFMDQLNVWEFRPRTEAFDRTGKPPIGTRWVECNKGDSSRIDVRSRIVVQETKRVSSISSGDVAAVFSATPPLEAIRLVLSLCMTVRLGIDNDRVL